MKTVKCGIIIKVVSIVVLLTAFFVSVLYRSMGFYISNYIVLSAFTFWFIYKILFYESGIEIRKNLRSKQGKLFALVSIILVIAWLCSQVTYFLD